MALRFNKAKRKVLPLSWGTSPYQYRLGREWIERSPEEKDLGVLLDKKPNTAGQCALAAQRATHALGCTQSSVASRAGG